MRKSISEASARLRVWAAARDWRRDERRAIRLLVPAVAVASVVTALVVSLPDQLPAPALGSGWVLRLLVALVLFYGALLFAVPVLRALGGELPIELSLRGARYREEAAATADALTALAERVRAQEADVKLLAEALADAIRRVDELNPAGEDGEQDQHQRELH